VFDQPDDVGVLSALLFQPPPRPGALISSLPPVLEEALASALRSSPAARPHSASSLSEALSTALDGPAWTRADIASWIAPLIDRAQTEQRSPATGSSSGTPELVRTSTRPDRPSRSSTPGWRHPLSLAALSLVLLAGGAGLVWREMDRPGIPGHEALPERADVIVEPATEKSPEPVVIEPEATTPSRPSAPPRESGVKAARSEAKGSGWVSVGVSKGWATVTIDGKAAGETPLYRVKLAAGTHTVKAVAHDGKTWTRKIRVNANREAKVIFER
jgi:hypothetical protein